ncbi:Uncharacterized protein M6B38_216310 [Iris pallida]|uniref:Uncharacterized protein n=1 Tax=Iris pallida TaxID=29817 RepID=A0AAX6DZR4_IRIPA|nr:Uncharacterized protein M6B38_216310 [Iris pallida]
MAMRKSWWWQVLILSIATSACHASAKDHGNPANEIVGFINANRTASKLLKLYNSPGLGCMALQYISQCTGNCSSNNTLRCEPPEADITEVYAPNCGVELPTVGDISGHIVGCQWRYLDPEQAVSQVLFRDKKVLALLHGKEHTEVGVGLRRVKRGASLWCVLFSTGKSDDSFVLEGGKGIEQKTGCFSGTDVTCSGVGRKVLFLDKISSFSVVLLLCMSLLL